MVKKKSSFSLVKPIETGFQLKSFVATAVRPSTQPGPAYGWPRAVSGPKDTAAGRRLKLVTRPKHMSCLVDSTLKQRFVAVTTCIPFHISFNCNKREKERFEQISRSILVNIQYNKSDLICFGPGDHHILIQFVA